MSTSTAALGDRAHDGRSQARAAEVMALIEPGFLTEMGWAPGRLVLVPPAGHRLVVRSMCRVNGCTTTATNKRHICFSCQRRLDEAGLRNPAENGHRFRRKADSVPELSGQRSGVTRTRFRLKADT